MAASSEIDTSSVDASQGEMCAFSPIPRPTLERTLPAACPSYQVLYLPQKGTQFCWNVVMLHLKLL